MLLVVTSVHLGQRDLLDEVVQEVLGTVLHVDRTCPDCDEQHGKPVLVDPSWHVSTSWAGGLSAVAVTDAGPVGIDLERVDATAFAGFADVALGPDEQAADPWQRAVAWTRKEAVLKATGEGLRTDPRTVDVRASREPVRGAELYDVAVPAGWCASAAVLTDRRPALEVRSPAG